MNSPDPIWQEERVTLSAPVLQRAKKLEILKQLDVCRQLDALTLQHLAPYFVVQTFARRVPIYRAGEPRDAVYGIVQGHVKILRDNRQEPRRTLLDILPPGTIFGEDALYASGQRNRTAIAYDAVTVVRIAKADFQRLLGEYPALYGHVFQIVGERLARAESKVQDLSLDGIARRLSKFLVEMASRYGTVQESGGVLISLRLPHREIADLVGSTRESVTMHLNDLRRQRLIDISDRRILITDLASLTAQS